MMQGMSAAPGGIGKSRRQSECYVERPIDGSEELQKLARAIGVVTTHRVNEGLISWYWPGFTGVSIYEHPDDTTLAVKIKLRSEKTVVLCDPIEGFPSAKLINAINLLRD